MGERFGVSLGAKLGEIKLLVWSFQVQMQLLYFSLSHIFVYSRHIYFLSISVTVTVTVWQFYIWSINFLLNQMTTNTQVLMILSPMCGICNVCEEIYPYTLDDINHIPKSAGNMVNIIKSVRNFFKNVFELLWCKTSE